MGTARAKEDAPGMYDGAEDHSRKNFKGKGKRPGGRSGKGKHHKKRHSRRK